MSDETYHRMIAQNYAILESLRHEQAWLELAINAHNLQIDHILDPDLSARLGKYISYLVKAKNHIENIQLYISSNP